MAVGGSQEGLVATGGGDARVQIWEDCTLQDKAEEAEEQEVTLLKQQRLSNALQVLMLGIHLSHSGIHYSAAAVLASVRQLEDCCSKFSSSPPVCLLCLIKVPTNHLDCLARQMRCPVLSTWAT